MYEATQVPASVDIKLHQEMAYLNDYPKKLAFYCHVPATSGGETIIGDIRRFTASLDDRFLSDLDARGLTYHRNFRAPDLPHGSEDEPKIYHATLRQGFSSDDHRHVEDECRRLGMEFEWLSDGSLSTRLHKDAFATHPLGGERVYFNHILTQIIDPEWLGPAYERYLDLYDRAGRPRPYHVTYGDGTQISPADYRAVAEGLSTVVVSFPWQRGDVMIVDNVYTAHGRNPYTGPRDVQVARCWTERPGEEIDVAQTVGTAPVEAMIVDEERTRRKQHLAAAFRLFARFGLYEGSAGHISARDPGHPDCYWMNPLGVHWAHMRVSDLALVDFAGAVVEGPTTLNRAGVAIHGQILAARPDVVSVAHSHSPYGKAWSALGRLLDPLTQDACAFYADHAVVPFSGIVLDEREGEHIAEVMGSMKAAILANHGLLTVGGSVDEAACWFISMERQCKVQLLAEAAGRPNVIDAETAALTARIQGSAEVAQGQFEVLWKLISEQEPELCG